MSRRMAYFDYHASTPCDPRVIDSMLPYFSEHFANAGSITHNAGQSVNVAVEQSRAIVAELINACRNEIVFTSSATESNNLVILGSEQSPQESRRQFVASTIEHKSVLAPMQHLALRGATIKLVSVDSLGHVRLDELEQLLSSSTTQLVSIQVANNEIGTIQNIVEIAELVHRYGALLHCDATQAIGRMHIDVELLNVDYLSFSAHKLYGPKGAAALYIRGGPKKSSLSPIMFGGGQEDGLRPGTINVPGVVGFATAAQLAMNEMLEELPRIRRQRDELEVRLLTSGFDIRRNGDVSNRLDSNSSLTFPVEAEALVARLPNFALSLGSACQSGALEPSPVLKAIGLTRNAAYQTIRIGIGRFTTNAEIDALACELLRHVFEVSSMKF